jgi:uncharacterized integral membrane protein
MKKTKKGKIIFWVVFIIIALIIFFQNRDFFLTQKGELSVTLYVYDYSTSEYPIAIYVIASFLIGFLIAFFFGLIEKYRTKKTIKELNAKLEQRDDLMDSLRNEVDSWRKKERGSGQSEPEVPHERKNDSTAEPVTEKSKS